MKIFDKLHIHIGKHKTGSSSFQLMLAEQTHGLYRYGICVVPYKLCNLMAAVAIRDDLPIPPNVGLEHTPTVENVSRRIGEYIKDDKINTIVVSSEHFSYFRTQEEISQLKKMLPLAKETYIYFVQRDSKEFLDSYRKQISRSGHGPSSHPSSPYYCGNDSWLLDDQAIETLWASNFNNYIVLKYCNTGIITPLAKAMGLPAEILKNEVFINRRPSIIDLVYEKAAAMLKGILRRIGFMRNLNNSQ